MYIDVYIDIHIYIYIYISMGCTTRLCALNRSYFRPIMGSIWSYNAPIGGPIDGPIDGPGVFAQYGSVRSSFVVSDRERGQLRSDAPTCCLRSNDSGGAAFYSFTVPDWIHTWPMIGPCLGPYWAQQWLMMGPCLAGPMPGHIYTAIVGSLTWTMWGRGANVSWANVSWTPG
jgi:hypothetical protein